ncbi:MAG: MAPEG family protein [Alphaproteobacteria bacterium]
MDPLYPAAVTALTLLLYLVVAGNAGRNRAKHKIAAPAMTGHPDFERANRVQMNTLEQMVCFLPAMWLYAWSLSAVWAAAVGLVWIVGRVIYSFAYISDPARRGPGMMISLLALIWLLGGALCGIGLKLV